MIKLGIIWIGFLIASAVCAQVPRYSLLWEETFDGAAVNTAYWSKIPRGQVDWCRYMSDHEDLYDVRNGNLVLYGYMNGAGITAESDTARYLTGGVYTKGKMTLRYGKVEVKARLQGAKGAWPAIWMLPDKGEWPDGGEIDIMERLNHDSIAYQTVHSYYTYVLKEKNPLSGSTGKINTTDYNVYAVEILPDSLVFSINGKHTFTYPRIATEQKGQYPFGTPYYLLIDMQLGGSWVGKINPEELPVKMEVDWVRFYRLEE